MSINFEKFGTGKPLILIHGLFGTLDNLKTLAKSLSNDFTVYLIDAPAHGKSSTPQPLNLTTMAAMVAEFIEQQGLSNVSMIGHSLGGKISMELALNHPSLIEKCIVADIAPVQYKRRHDDIITALKSVDVTVQSRKLADELLQKKIPELGVRGFLLKSFNPRKAPPWSFDLTDLAENYDELIKGNSAKSYNRPILFIIGGNSNYVSAEHKSEIMRRFPQAQSKIINGAGHWLHAEKPVAFEKSVEIFYLNS